MKIKVAHYPKLLNMHDDGERMQFDTPEEWISRLRVTGTLPVGKPAIPPLPV